VELLVALTLLGVVLGAFAIMGMRQEEAHRSLAMRARARVQLREATAALPIELRGVSPEEGDIPPGEARDSTLEFRSTVAAGVACAVHGDVVTLPGADGEWPMSALLSRPEAGDSVWFYASTAGGGGAWAGRALERIESGSAECALFDGEDSGARLSLRLAGDTTAGSPVTGSPVRVTRRVRYSIYRSSTDGNWYLGAREWNGSQGRFDVVQPIAGPFTSPRAATGERSRFTYHDRSGTELPSGSADTHRISRVVLTLCAEEARKRRRSTDAPSDGCDGDATTLAVGLRDRP
jgi:hypothetical protein